MRSRKGFTLIELMVVIVIVAILAAVVVPLLISRVERAKYSEGKAIASQIATAVRAEVAENGIPTSGTFSLTVDLGFKTSELDAKYFSQILGPMTVTGVDWGLGGASAGLLDYTITLPPRGSMGLNSGNLVLICEDNVTTFTPDGI